MDVLAYLHTALLVTDLDQAHRFYGETLGLPLAERPLNFSGLWYQIGPTQLHLIQSPHVVDDRVVSDKAGRNRHVAFAVADITQAQAKLEAQGYPVHRSSSGRPALFTQDPDGNIIELSLVTP